MTGTVRMVSLFGDGRFEGFQGREGTALAWTNETPPQTPVGSITVLGEVSGGIIADAALFELRRNTHFFTDRHIAGSVRLLTSPTAFRHSALSIKISGDLGGDLTVVDNGTGHGELAIAVSRRTDCSVMVQAENEFGWQNAAVDIAGPETTDVTVRGIAHEIRKREDGTLEVHLNSALQPRTFKEILEASRDRRLTRQIIEAIADHERRTGDR